MGTLAIITGIASLIAGGIGVVQSIKRDREQAKLASDNMSLNEKVSQQNFDLQKEQFEYQKQLNDTVMQREDNAMQRQVADLKAAGLSPLMVSGGASATPLNSASAPQQDISGINEATHNMMSAYNDIFNRKMSRLQFGLQAATNIADMKTQLAESKLKQNQIRLQNDILGLDKKYYESHPERNLGLQQILTNALAAYLEKNSNSVTPDLVKDKVSDVLHDSGLETPSGDFMTYGGLDSDTKYAHTLDNENYDNNRPTRNLIAEETKEKFYKSKLKKTDTEDIRKKLYATDDYLKKHISLDNWLKKDKDFISFYLKYGKFEGHKKYFE